MKTALLIVVLFITCCLSRLGAQSPNLGSAEAFTLFTKSGNISNTGTSDIRGKIGTNNGSITGFTVQPGQQEISNSISQAAATDLQIAYDEVYNRNQTFPSHAPVLGNGETLVPGVYNVAQAAVLEGDLTLDADGNSGAIFIIKVIGSFSPASYSRVVLVDAAMACNVYWVIEGGALTIGEASEMKGNFMVNTGPVFMSSHSQLVGRLLSTNGDIQINDVKGRLPVCGTLPVSDLDFRGVKTSGEVFFNWSASSETSFSKYELERSQDAVHYAKIGTVSAAYQPGRTYTWTDRSPFEGTNFYRLKMIDIDGSFQYSKIIKISTNSAGQISIFPNPVSGKEIFLQLYGQSRGDYTVSVFDLRGARLLQKTFTHLPQNIGIKISLVEINQPGMYTVTVTGANQTVARLPLLIR